MQIIPAINAKTFEEAKKQISIASAFSEWLHLDITDRIFSPAEIWGNPEEIKKLEIKKLRWEAHLMVNNPEAIIEDWLRVGIKRVVVHVEAIKNADLILEKCRKYKTEVMIAINPATPVEDLLPFLDKFQYFQFLVVKPGWAGQKFNPEVINKIRFLKKKAPDVKIEIDGGITLETAKLCKEAGADILVSASYILQSKNPKEAYEELSNI